MKSSKDTRVIIELRSGIELPSWGSGSYFHAQVQFQEIDSLPECQCGSQDSDFGQVQIGVLKLTLGF